MTTAAITGITGLAGKHVAKTLHALGHEVIGISRRPPNDWADADIRSVPDLTDAGALTNALRGCDVIFHFADRADRKSYTEGNIGAAAKVLSAIRSAAARNGISRIVAASSIYAELSDRPADLYGRSKRAMEAVGMAATPGSPAAILRLPPLYGPGARGAVRHIARAIEQGWPLPFGLARAPRRFLSLDELADLCNHLATINQTTFDRALGRILVPVSAESDNLFALCRAIGQGSERLLPVPGIDRIIGGKITPDQLDSHRETLAEAVGWRAQE